jgi:hypothetical protein
MFASIRKFIIAAIGLAVTVGWIDSGAAEGLIAVATAALVWLVPNE